MAPTILANVIIVQFLTNCEKVTFLSIKAIATAIIFPVINSPPPSRITNSPIGNTAAPTKLVKLASYSGIEAETLM